MAGLKTVLALPPAENALAGIDRRTKNAQPKRVTAKLRKVIQLLLDGDAKTLKGACERADCNPDYASRELRKPHVRAYIDERTVGSLSDAKPIAAARMVDLMHSNSDKVSLDSSKHVLAIGGIAPPTDGRASLVVNNTINGHVIAPGYVINLAPQDNRTPQVVDGFSGELSEKQR